MLQRPTCGYRKYFHVEETVTHTIAIRVDGPEEYFVTEITHVDTVDWHRIQCGCCAQWTTEAQAQAAFAYKQSDARLIGRHIDIKV